MAEIWELFSEWIFRLKGLGFFFEAFTSKPSTVSLWKYLKGILASS